MNYYYYRYCVIVIVIQSMNDLFQMKIERMNYILLESDLLKTGCQ